MRVLTIFEITHNTYQITTNSKDIQASIIRHPHILLNNVYETGRLMVMEVVVREDRPLHDVLFADKAEKARLLECEVADLKDKLREIKAVVE
jgi:hypothetical protein